MASTPEKLYVTYVDVDRDLLKIWGQRNRIGATYIERQLLQLLPEFNRTVSPNPGRIHKGMFCFAKYTDDNYYRARVISRVQEDSVGVLFVDYGNRDVIKLSNIRIQEGNEGDVLTKMSEQAEEYYLAKIAAPPSGWSIDIVSEIRRDICYDEFHYQIIGQIGDQKILELEFRNDDFSSYLVKKQLARPLPLPVQRELILSYCSLVSNEIKQEETFRDSPRLPFSPSVPPPSLRGPPGLVNATTNMQFNYAKANKTITFPCPPPHVQYASPRHLRAPVHQNDQSIPKNSYFSPVSQMNNHMPMEPNSIQPVNSGLNPLTNHQLNQFYQMQGNPSSSNNDNNLIEMIAHQVKQYIAKDTAKAEAEAGNVPHHYVNSVLEVGNTYNAIISHIDDGPWSFSIQLLPSEDELKKLMKDLASVELIPIKPPIILGHPCIAASTLHGSFCRGVVVSISRSAVKVYFVDFGNTEDLLSSSIYELPPRFFKVGVLSQKFSLSGLQKVAYSDDIKKFFEEVVKDEVLVLRVDSLGDDNLPTCELYIKQRNIKRILNEKMRELKNSVAEYIPKVGDTEHVLVTWVVSPQKFYVQMKKRDAELNGLKQELAEVGTKGQTVTYQQLSVGCRCVCLYESDGHWYRVVITSVDSENAITVFYVDYGNIETVKISHLKRVDGACLINQMGNQAIQCCLKGFEDKSYDPELAKRLEALTLEKEFQMTVVSLEKQLLCVNLYDNGNDIGAMLLAAAQPKVNEMETTNISLGSVWDSPESRKAAVPNKLEKDKPQIENFLEKRGANLRGHQIRRKNQRSGSVNNVESFKAPARESHARLKSRFDGKERRENEKDNYWSEPKFEQQKPWKIRGPKEFGNWEPSRPAGSRGQSRGYDEFNEVGKSEGSKGFGQNRTRIGRNERKPEKKFGRGRRNDEEWKDVREGKRFESRRGGEETRRKFDDRGDKSNEKRFSRSPIKKEDVAPPGSRFEERVVEVGSSERGIVTYYFSPDEFFVQLLAQEEEFRKMMKDIQCYYSDKYSIRDPVQAGDIVIAQFSFDKILYRAEVIKSSPVTVRYVDYGNQEPVQPKGIWLVDKEFLKLPQQVVKCRLSGVQPLGSDWPPPGSAADKFFEFPEYRCTFLRREGDMYEVSMEVVESGKDVAGEIIAAGLGRPLDPKLDVPETDYSLLRNQILRLYVPHVESSSKFFVVVNPRASELIAEAISAIGDVKKGFPPVDWSSLEPETPCLASPDEVSWHRGNIVKTDGDCVTVWLCDRGDCVQLSKEKVVRVPGFLKAFQPQVVECCVSGLSGVEDEENFKKTVGSKSHLMHILSVTDKRLSVILYDEEGRLFDFEKDCDAPRAIEPIGQLPIISQQLPLVISQLDSVKEAYIQRIADEGDLMNFLEQINGFYAEGGEEFEAEEDIAGGTLVAAKSKLYDSWYRGRVMGPSDGNFEIFYIDYGNREVLPRENVKKLDASFIGVSAFCGRVAFDFEDFGRTEETNQKIWELCEEKDLVGCFRNEGGKIVLELNANGMNVADLVKNSISGGEATEGLDKGAPPEAGDAPKGDEEGELRVFVSHVDRPSRFWAIKEALINELQQFNDKFEEICGTLPDKKEVEVNEMVGSVFSGMWYRARVIGVEGTRATVQFIDFGNTSEVDLATETMKELTPDLVKVPAYARPFALKGTWGEDSTAKFEEIILRNEDPVRVVVLEETEPAVVDLFQNGRSVAEMLLEEMTAAEVDDDVCVVYITHSISPRDFYVQRETCTDALNRLAERLWDASDFEDPARVEENELYAARYPKDEAWYRARVTSHTGNGMTVHFIDYGNTSLVTEVKSLPGDLMEIPPMSENCCLEAGNEDCPWSEQACDTFAEYADGRALEMKVVGRTGRKAVVELFDQKRNVREELERRKMLVTHAESPRRFYVRYADDEMYETIEKALRDGGEGEEDVEDRGAGKLCQARFEEDGGWYRCKVLRDLGPEGWEVFFVDFGNTDASKELRKLPKEVEDIPPRAFECSLDLGEEAPSESAIEEFVNLTGKGETVFLGRVVTQKDPNLTIVSLKLDGKLVEETLKDNSSLSPRSPGFDRRKGVDAEECDKPKGEEDVSEESALRNGRDEEDVRKKEASTGVASRENGDGESAPGLEKTGKVISNGYGIGNKAAFEGRPNHSRNKFNETVPGSISRGEKEECLDDDWDTPSANGNSQGKDPDAGENHASQSAPDIPPPSHPVREKTSLGEKIVAGAVNGSLGV